MDLAEQLRASLAAQQLPPASASFLQTLIAARTPPPPRASLLATARARLLACDLCDGGILDAAAMASLPAAAADPGTTTTTLPRAVYVQVVDAENLSLSRWEQVEALEAAARGTRGRQVVDDEALAAAAAAGKNAVHRLVLQDCTGRTVYAVETARMPGIGIGTTNIGEKMLLSAGTVVARGTVLLTPDKTVFLGGRVDAWHEAWMSARLARLKAAAAAGADRPQ
ncbi:mediated genome instability Rmi1 [Cordyceps militaris]|uniref:Mediated genome instability Rmi1 n=1 Tax=Cordyceps militaris TaxID=73501 RepID=A0A2H4SNK9_CORMI|nr:mediated genome instability Rmi1 [Cordyceps militaris]